ncbi:MAG: hypothetical protein RJA29_900 [Pseudomonadota bacterium]
MKLQTNIPPRRDGTVTVLGQDRQTYVFAADDEGLLSADVADEATVAALLATGHFWPADADDAEQALALVKQAQGDDEDDEDDEDEPEGGLPVEANTPPKRRGRPRKAE